jgi:hypothetical protein
MNERAAAALVDAAMRGVRQIKGHLDDPYGGRCAGGVVIEAIFGPIDVRTLWNADCIRMIAPLFTERDTCPHECGWKVGRRIFLLPKEWTVMVHMNNDHDDDFLKIARTLGE